MITREKFDQIFDDENTEIEIFREKGIDHIVKAISLLREKIPYDTCKSVIGCVEHDKIYLCDIDDVLEHIDEQDAIFLVECNLFIDAEFDCLAVFV